MEGFLSPKNLHFKIYIKKKLLKLLSTLYYESIHAVHKYFKDIIFVNLLPVLAISYRTAQVITGKINALEQSDPAANGHHTSRAFSA